MTAAAEVHAARARLAESRHALRARPRGEVIEVLAALVDHCRDAESPIRRRLAAELPAAAGFGPEVVREGLERGFGAFRGAALEELLAAELASAPSVTGFDETSVLLAGSIPMPSLLSLVLPLAVASPVLAKPASRDPLTPRLVAESLAALDPELGRCVEVTPFPSEDREAASAFFASECLVATGSDETLAEVTRQVVPPRRLVAYGHRLSLAVVDTALGPEAKARAAGGLAIDVALWDQAGCLSPIAVYTVGSASAAADFGGQLAEALARCEATLPRAPLEARDGAQFAQEFAAAEMRIAASGAGVLYGGGKTPWCVSVEADARARPAPLSRFLRVHPVADAASLPQALEPYGRHLAGVALAGFGRERAQVARALLQLGASRVCEPGSLQAPPVDWRHDGLPLLLPIARLGAVE